MDNVVSFSGRQPLAASSSGRKPDFESGNAGSNPAAASTKHFPIGAPPEDILKAMEEKAVFTMDVSIKEALYGSAEDRAKIDAARIAKKLENKNRW